MFRQMAISHRISLKRHCEGFMKMVCLTDKIKFNNKTKFRSLLETSTKKTDHQRKLNTVRKKDNLEYIAKLEESTRKAYNSNSMYQPLLPATVFQRQMWQNPRTGKHIIGVLLNPIVKGFNTVIWNQTQTANIHSSSTLDGYPIGDNILHIKPYKPDFAEEFPSVSFILNETMKEESKIALEKWEKEQMAEMGGNSENFEGNPTEVGSVFHKTVLDYFTRPAGQMEIGIEVEGIWDSVSDVLKSLSSLKAIESNVTHPVLKYRGIFDAIADYEDKPTLIEWKKFRNPEWSHALMYDSSVQLAAYFGAVCVDLNYSHLNVRDALLVLAYTDGSKADVYHFSSETLGEKWSEWMVRLDQYKEMYGEISEEISKEDYKKIEE